ncbi:MAG TPA: FGGY-family carbohydrate kinase [Pyrinomonadaceae bacterium]|nr:FGGY-family carbohydrate kinase [Pyrinomonadaceae bacterium]
MDNALFIAIDLGAGSGRVFLAGLTADEFLLEEIRRFHYPAREADGHLRWDFGRILDETKTGLRAAAARGRELGQPIQSIGVASWGVDYGLIDAAGKLLEDPICYRDERTEGLMDEVVGRISREELFARTGLQFMAFNTLFQLYAHKRAGIHPAADRLLLIPDLLHFSLTGQAVTEYTNATTTQMINARSRSWDVETLSELELPVNLLTEVVFAGAEVGNLSPDLAAELGLEDVQVIAPATHDTGSAVAGAPLEDGWAFISSGTWSLVGVERDSPLINADVLAHNFTNEGGAFDTVRFLKNVMGLWILESCRKEWSERGIDVDYDKLLLEVDKIHGFPALIFPDDGRFFKPQSMLSAIAEQLSESGQSVTDHPVMITKVILDSLALRYASVLRTIESLTGRKIKGVQIVGGGSKNEYLNQITANVTNLTVAAGPVEATVTGNVLVQAIAAKRFSSLTEARAYVTAKVKVKRFTPNVSRPVSDAMQRYAELEARYSL